MTIFNIRKLKIHYCTAIEYKSYRVFHNFFIVLNKNRIRHPLSYFSVYLIFRFDRTFRRKKGLCEGDYESGEQENISHFYTLIHDFTQKESNITLLTFLLN